jgi:hypothetical protein
MHKYPFCFTFLVSRIFLLLIFFFFSFVPCLLRFITSIWYEIREYLDTDIHICYHLCNSSWTVFVVQHTKKRILLHICLLLSCKRKCLIFAWLCFFFLFFFFLYKSIVLIYMNFFSIVKTIVEQQYLSVDKCRRMWTSSYFTPE